VPYLKAGSGADVSTRYLAEGLEKAGIEAVLQGFHRYFEFMPWLLSGIPAPENTDIILTNSWNGYAFSRKGIPMVTVDRLFILDPLLNYYKNMLQKIYHNVLIKPYIKASVKRSHAVVAVSEYTAGVMSDILRIPRPRVILNAVDTDFFTPSPEKTENNDRKPFRLFFSGNLSRRKGADLLSPIMQRLGKGFELYYTAGLRKKELPGSIKGLMHPLGSLTQAQMRQQYRRADLLLFPSRGEGLSRAIMESLACGTPVVTSNVSSMPEAVTPEVGRLCRPDNPDAFANAIKELASDPVRLNVNRAAARERAEKFFELKRMVEDYVNLFQMLC